MSDAKPGATGGVPGPSRQVWIILMARLATIERAVQGAREDSLDDDQKHLARQEAHKLAGSLGLFQITRAGQLAGELELLLTHDDRSERGSVLVTELRQEMESAQRETFEDRQEDAERTQAPPGRILIADDDEVMARMIVSALQRQGYEVVRVGNGADAVHASTAGEPFDLILLDLQMPVLDGFAACQALRREPDLAEVPIVLITAQSNDQLVRNRHVEGASDYLIKPFTIADLRARVQFWLNAKGSSA